jgi:hypothetical protein
MLSKSPGIRYFTSRNTFERIVVQKGTTKFRSADGKGTEEEGDRQKNALQRTLLSGARADRSHCIEFSPPQAVEY